MVQRRIFGDVDIRRAMCMSGTLSRTQNHMLRCMSNTTAHSSSDARWATAVFVA